MRAPLPPDEISRLEALHRYHILDTEEEEVYDNITRLATHLCGTPISTVTLIDADRQWFKSRVGLDLKETPRDIAFCAHAILEPDGMEVGDAREDPRFADNPLVTGDPGIQFYAGAPLVTSDGNVLGTLCVIDRRPRALSADQRAALQALSRHVVCQLEMRHAVAGQALVLSSLDQARQAAEQNGTVGPDNDSLIERAATFIFETVPDKAYQSTDAALAHFFGYETFEQLTEGLSDI